MTDVFARERRSASPEPYRSQSSPSKRATQSPSLYTPMSETTYDLMTTDMLHSTRYVTGTRISVKYMSMVTIAVNNLNVIVSRIHAVVNLLCFLGRWILTQKLNFLN